MALLDLALEFGVCFFGVAAFVACLVTNSPLQTEDTLLAKWWAEWCSREKEWFSLVNGISSMNFNCESLGFIQALYCSLQPSKFTRK
jgi:hypothetical protein